TGHYDQGCGWTATTTFSVPANWPSGYYAARFPTSHGLRNVLFVVKAARSGRKSPIVVISATNTYQAYNSFGGKSVYDDGSTDGMRASQVSFDRPYDRADGLGDFELWEQHFVAWLQKQQRAFDVLTDADLESADALTGYKLALIVGHSEYWT